MAIRIDKDKHDEVLYFRIGTENTIQSVELFNKLIKLG